MLLTLLALAWAYPLRRVRLSHVPELVFRDNSYTITRRSESYPQLQKEHGRWWYDAVHTVRCRNLGFRGNDLLWTCTTDDLSPQYRISNPVVSCEGWDGPGDAYVVEGSCFLGFSVEKIPIRRSTTPPWAIPPARDDSLLQDIISWVLRALLITFVPGLFLMISLSSCCCHRRFPRYRARNLRPQVPTVSINMGLPPGSVDYDEDERRRRRDDRSGAVATTVVY